MTSQSVNLFAQALGAAVVLALFSTPPQAFAETESEYPLITLDRFCKMDRSKVVERETVRVRGTVTFINREWQLLFVQEDECAVKVFLEKDADLKIGQLVELTGRTEFGDEANIMMLTSSEVIGEGSIPEPRLLDETLPFSLDVLYRWSEVEGPIYSAVANEKSYFLYVASKRFGVFVHLPRTRDLPPVETLRNYRVRARGNLAMSTQEQRPFRVDLLVPTGTTVELTPNAAPENGIKLRPLAETGQRDMRGDAEAPARFRAVVRSTFPPNRLFLSDESGALLVELADATVAAQLKVGDVVEVEGRIDRSRKNSYLRDAHARLLGKGYSEPPAETLPKEGPFKIGHLIQSTGMLVASNTEKNWLLLRDGATYFRVWYAPDLESQIDRAGKGSQISVAGGCWISPSDDSAFDILAREMTVLFNVPRHPDAPAPTLASSQNEAIETAEAVKLAASPGDIFRALLMVLLLIFLGVLIWLVYRRLTEQQQFQKSIHEQLSNLSHIARLNTLAEMVGALAHELNQPLASVSNYAATAELLSRKEPTDSEKLASILTHIGKEAFRAGEIIRRLRHLVRKKTPGSLPVHISEIIHETVELFKTQHVTSSGLVQVDVPDDLPTVQADSVQIQQVILNLLLNARDAIDSDLERVPTIKVQSTFENGMVYVSVADNGVGINSPNPDAIFEPYFTTRENGTGLGLAISRTIIETHGGKIVAEKGTPYGTLITFSLPVSRAPAVIAG